jgi:nucleoside-diphosphate-sugar epimerase
MRTLIIGSSSSVGNALIPVISKFSQVLTAGRHDCDIILNIGDPIEKIKLPDNLDVIIHTAAEFAIKTDVDLVNTEYVNVLGTLKLCQAAKQANSKHFVLVSSMFSCLKSNSPFFNIYSLSKKHSEEIAQYYCSAHSLPLTILRPSRIYGIDDRYRRHQPFIYALADQAEKGEDIAIQGSHDALRNFIHIEDLIKIISLVVQNKIVGTYNCMHPKDITFSEIASAAISAFHGQGAIYFLGDKPDIPDNIFEMDDILYKQIGFYPQITIEEGMKKIANFRSLA